MADAMTAVLDDPGLFGEKLLGRPLWQHQLDFARSTARIRCVAAGRQVGKSTVAAVVSLHAAATNRGHLVLLVSAGEEASKRLLAECAGLLADSPFLRGSVLDESKSTVTLSNGSRILSVPASQRQIRGNAVDLLVVDEAGFVPQDVWQAAEPAVIARPGSRIILLSSPWGGSDHFFRQLWNRGMDHPDGQVASFHWPSSANPLVDRVQLEEIRGRSTAEYFAREYLAEWTDESGAYFTESEIESVVADYRMTAPEDLVRWMPTGEGYPAPAAAGIDWGFAADANALVLLSQLDDHFLNWDRLGGERMLFVPWLEARHRWAYTDFIERIVEIGARYHLVTVASELNGAGAFPTEHLRNRMFEKRRDTAVAGVNTTARRKQSGFGKLKGLIQQKRIVLPRHPELLKQLRGLQFEQLSSGQLRIAVPDAVGHDDIADALLQAVSCVSLRAGQVAGDWWDFASAGSYDGELVSVGSGESGLRIPERPLPVPGDESPFHWAEGAASGSQW